MRPFSHSECLNGSGKMGQTSLASIATYLLAKAGTCNRWMTRFRSSGAALSIRSGLAQPGRAEARRRRLHDLASRRTIHLTHVADVGDGRAAILRRPRHAPARHDELALAVFAGANDRRELIGEDSGEERKVAGLVMSDSEEIAGSGLCSGDAKGQRVRGCCPHCGYSRTRSSARFRASPIALTPLPAWRWTPILATVASRPRRRENPPVR